MDTNHPPLPPRPIMNTLSQTPFAKLLIFVEQNVISKTGYEEGAGLACLASFGARLGLAWPGLASLGARRGLAWPGLA
jgi:hypothetical protein